MTYILGSALPPLLDDRFPLPVDRPFSTGEAVAAGVSKYTLARLTEAGLLRRIVRGTTSRPSSPTPCSCAPKRWR
jgi:hypothetical protein